MFLKVSQKCSFTSGIQKWYNERRIGQFILNIAKNLSVSYLDKLMDAVYTILFGQALRIKEKRLKNLWVSFETASIRLTENPDSNPKELTKCISLWFCLYFVIRVTLGCHGHHLCPEGRRSVITAVSFNPRTRFCNQRTRASRCSYCQYSLCSNQWTIGMPYLCQ